MPRRSSRQTAVATPEKSETRVTRKSIRGNKPEKEEEEDVPPSPAKSDASKSSRRSAKSAKEASSPSTSPAPTRRGRSAAFGDSPSPRGRGGRGAKSQSRGRGRGKKVQEEEEDEDEDEDSEEEGDEVDEDIKPKKAQQSTPRGRGRGRGKGRGAAAGQSPRARKGRARKAESEEEDEEEEEGYNPKEEAKKVRSPPARASSRRGRAAAKEKDDKEDESPRRRSGRKAAKEAEEKIRTDAEKEEPKEEDEEPKEEEEEMETEDVVDESKPKAETTADEAKGTKRKHEEVEKTASPAKKQKTEEAESISKDTEEKTAEVEAKSTEEDDEKPAEKVETVTTSGPQIEEISEESAGEEPAKEETKMAKDVDVPMDDTPSAPLKEAKAEELTKTSPVKEPQPSPVKEPTPQPSPVKEPTPQPSPVKEPTPQPSPVKEPTPQPSPVKEPSPAKEPTPQPSPVVKPAPVDKSLVKKVAAEEKPVSAEPVEDDLPAELSKEETSPVKDMTEESEAPVLKPETATESASVEAMDTSECEPAPVMSSVSEETGKLEDYVMINMEDVPAPDSSEVSTSIPEVRVTPPEQDNGVDDSNGPIDAPPVLSSSQTVGAEHAAASQEASVNSISSPTTNNDCNSSAATEGITKSTPAKIDSKDPLFCRRFVSNPAMNFSSVIPDNTFTLVSYNVLADCHALREGLKSYNWASAEHLALEYRHRRLMEELRYLNADIVCLQEIGPEHYHKYLQPQLTQLGYQGTFIKRPDNYYDEGEATFIRTNRFTVLQTELLDLSAIAKRDLDSSGVDTAVLQALKEVVTRPAVAIITRLQCVKTNKKITIGNVHITWDWFKRTDVQCVQAAATIRELVTVAGGADQPHVICGDFNSCPDSPVHQLTKEGYLNDASMAALQGVQEVKLADGRMCPMVNLWWRGFQHTSNNLKSAYATVLGTDPVSSKFPHDGLVRQVDYIWYASGSLDVVGVAETAPETNIQEGIPNAIYPSDHVSTKAMLSFKG